MYPLIPNLIGMPSILPILERMSVEYEKSTWELLLVSSAFWLEHQILTRMHDQIVGRTFLQKLRLIFHQHHQIMRKTLYFFLEEKWTTYWVKCLGIWLSVWKKKIDVRWYSAWELCGLSWSKDTKVLGVFKRFYMR